MSQGRYLQVTYRGGQPIAAYLYLPRQPGDVSARCEKFSPGLLIDYAGDGRPIGLEITAPRTITLEIINQALSSLQLEPISAEELGPLAA